MALQLEEAGCISSDEEENGEFLLDPLHKQDYNAWKKGNVISERTEEGVDWDDVRNKCV